MAGSYLGPRYDDDEIEDVLVREEAPFEKVEWDDMPGRVAELIADQVDRDDRQKQRKARKETDPSSSE